MEPTTTTPSLGSPVLQRTGMRTDAWWMQPLLVVTALTAFGVYTFWAAWQNAHFRYEAGGAHYLSPFYSPYIPESFLVSIGLPREGIFHNLLSPAFFILWMPLVFRATCYYYRKSYFRSFFADPLACAVREPKKGNYKGETGLFVLNNLHRYALYLAIFVVVVLWWDTIVAFTWRDEATGALEFGVGVGTLVLLLNVVLLSAYTFGCHSFRHIVGGQLDCFSCENFNQERYKWWRSVTSLNKNHMLWA
ncbi:MAG: hypothetical protein ACRDHY_04510, partial [Anaerolineales bacterium]